MIPALTLFLAFLSDLGSGAPATWPADARSRWRFVNSGAPYPADDDFIEHIFEALDQDPGAGLPTLPGGAALTREEADRAFLVFARWNLLLIAPLWRTTLYDDLVPQGDALIHFLERGWDDPEKTASWCVTAVHHATELDREMSRVETGSSTPVFDPAARRALAAIRLLMGSGRPRSNAMDIQDRARRLVMDFVAAKGDPAKVGDVGYDLQIVQMAALETILDRAIIGESAEIDWRPAMLIPEDHYAFGQG